MGSNEIRRTNDKIVESQLDETGQAGSQANGSKSWNEKSRKYIGPGFTTLVMGFLAFQGGGAEGSATEVPGTALTQRGNDKAIGLPPAFPRAASQDHWQKSNRVVCSCSSARMACTLPRPDGKGDMA